MRTSQKSSKSLLLSFLVILLLGGLFWKLQQQKRPVPVQKLPWEKLSDVSIQTEAGEIFLKKEGDFWVLSNNKNLPADKDKVESLLDSLKSIDDRELVSGNKEKYASFQVDKEKPLVTLKFSDNQTRSLVVGKTSFSRRGTFIRFVSKDEVFIIPVYLDSVINSKDWERLRILDSVSYETKKITLSASGKSINLEKDEGEKLNTLLNGLDYLKGEKVCLKEDKKDQLLNPEFTISLFNDDNKETKVNFYSSKSKEYLVLIEGESVVFTITEEKYKSIKQSFNALF